MNRRDTLDYVQWGMLHFGSVCTGGDLQRRDIRRCEDAGLVKSNGLVELCDPDGFTYDPERLREGFVLTPKGEQYLTELKEKEL